MRHTKPAKASWVKAKENNTIDRLKKKKKKNQD